MTTGTSTLAVESRGGARVGTCRVVGVAAAFAGAAIVRSVSRSRPARRAVAPELRHPVLFLRYDVTNALFLAVARRVVVRLGPSVGGVDVTDREIPPPESGVSPVRVRLYQKPGRQRPSGALLWIHGGGMIMGAPEQDDRWMSLIADELGILVASVDYRLAPENPFPAGLDDCMAALRWLHTACDELGVDPRRVAVGGASAGGGLAAAVALRARDEGDLPLCFQLLNYPMLDDRTVLRPDHDGTGEFIWTPASNRYGWISYLGSEPDSDNGNVYCAPGRATDLAGLPPAWIGVGSLDLFHAEDTDYARRLDAAGVPCVLVDEPGMYHGADQLAKNAPQMREYRASMVDTLRRHLG